MTNAINLSIPTELLERIENSGAAGARKRSAFVRMAIEKELERIAARRHTLPKQDSRTARADSVEETA